MSKSMSNYRGTALHILANHHQLSQEGQGGALSDTKCSLSYTIAPTGRHDSTSN